MRDIFDTTILCKKCNRAMKHLLVSKNGFNLRAVKCDKCEDTIIHPTDKKEYEEFVRLKQKEYEVKMRMVGNSYAVSIPREIVDFMKDQENMIDDMVKLTFDNLGRVSLMFNTPEMQENARTISSREVKVIKNGKVYHEKQISDSANPKNNKKIIYQDNLNTENEEEQQE